MTEPTMSREEWLSERCSPSNMYDCAMKPLLLGSRGHEYLIRKAVLLARRLTLLPSFENFTPGQSEAAKVVSDWIDRGMIRSREETLAIRFATDAYFDTIAPTIIRPVFSSRQLIMRALLMSAARLATGRLLDDSNPCWNDILGSAAWEGDFFIPPKEDVLVEGSEVCDMVREIIGIPHSLPALASTMLVPEAWNTLKPQVWEMFRKSSFERLPEIRSSLVVAGCTDEAILAHLEEPCGKHFPGCWVVDWILGW